MEHLVSTPAVLKAPRSLQAWLQQEMAPKRSNIRGGYPSNSGQRAPPPPPLSQQNQGESKSRTTNQAALGMPPWKRVREDRAPRAEPPLGRPTRNYGLGNPIEAKPIRMPRPGPCRELDLVMRMMHQRRIRPSQVQKCVNKNYSGSGDPRDRVAKFIRVIRAEEVLDFPTQYVGFGLTLEDDATTWFDSVEIREFNTIELFDKFVEEFFQCGIAHNTVS